MSGFYFMKENLQFFAKMDHVMSQISTNLRVSAKKVIQVSRQAANENIPWADKPTIKLANGQRTDYK